jgi:hypothetical protein
MPLLLDERPLDSARGDNSLLLVLPLDSARGDNSLLLVLPLDSARGDSQTERSRGLFLTRGN